MKKKILKIFKVGMGICFLLVLFGSTALFFKANSIFQEVWNSESFRPIEWSEYSKDFRIVSESEFDQRSISILFAGQTMYKYNEMRRMNQLEYHLLGFIVHVYCKILVNNDEALTQILSSSYLGAGVKGFSNASDYYFGKNIREANLAESALLFAIWIAPGRYNPFLNIKHAYEGRNRVLEKLVSKDASLKDEIHQAINSPITLTSKKH